jgi:hypothetical protein
MQRQEDWLVYGVFDRPDSPKLLADRVDVESYDNVVRIVRDDPSLDVVYHGLSTHTPSWLRARDNWFLRYQTKLEPYLIDPRVAQVFTFAKGKLSDPLSSFKAARGGPCPLPRGAPWPACGFCSTPMAMVGVLDFREFSEVSVPKGSLVVHGCPACPFCADEETWAIHWLIEGEPYELHGDLNAIVEVGTRWWVTEYPTPDPETCEELEKSLPKSGSDLEEWSLFENFSSLTDKVGGHEFWIQRDDKFTDPSYVFIGQMTGGEESLIGWDSPIIYLMYSPKTGKTIAWLQSF